MTKLPFAILAATLAMVTASPVAAQQTGVHAMHIEGPILSFSIEETVQSPPDRAGVGAGVTTMAPTAVAALRANSGAMEKLVAALKARGVAAKDIQTSGLNLSPQYDYNNRADGQPPRFIGYQVSNMVRVTTDDIASLGELLDALVAAGGTNIEGPWFSVKDADAKLAPARTAAFRTAGERAADYARLAGYGRAELLSVTEGSSMAGPRPMPYAMAAEAAMGKAVIEPGQVGSTLTLQFQYRLVK